MKMGVWFAVGMAMAVGGVEFPKVENFNPSWPSAKPGMSYSVNLPTAALLGNGSLGAVNGGDANHKLFVLTRGDFWSCGDLSNGYRPNNVRALSFADFKIGPGMASVTGTDTLDIGCGVLRTEGGFGKGTVKLESWVDANEDLFVVRGVSSADGDWAVHLVAHGNPDEFPVTVKGAKDGFFVRRTTVDLTNGDPRGWTTNATAALSVVGAELADIKIENRTHVWAWAKVRAGQPFAFVVATDPARRFTFAELEAKRAAHDRWWREWWALNDIALGDAELERFYYGSLYLMGAGVRQGKQAVGLYGIWPTTDQPSWHNDIHLNYNFIATYYGCWAANRCGVADTAADPLLAYLPQAERNAREGLKNLVSCKGHHYPNTEAYLKRRTDLADGIPDAAHFPVALSPYGVSAEGNDSHWSQISDGVFQCAPYCTHWEYTLDREYLKHVWPLLDKTANFFLKWCEKETRPDGSYRYLVYDSHWEGSGLVKNSAPALGCLRHLLETLVAAEGELRAAGIELSDAKVAAWKDLLDHLSDYPVGVRKVGDREVRMLSGVERDDGVADIALCCNAVTLEGIHPGEWAAFDMTDEFRTLATNCVNAMIQLGGEQRVWKGGNQTPKLCIQAIRLGYPCEAVIDAFKKYEIRGNGQTNFHLRDNTHGVEKIGAIEFVNSMLLQSDHGFVKVFPNWTGKDAKFRDLRAKGAFLVSAEMQGGKVGPVTVKSLKGGTFRLVNPWPAKAFANCRYGHTRHSREPTLEFEMRPSEVRILNPCNGLVGCAARSSPRPD